MFIKNSPNRSFSAPHVVQCIRTHTLHTHPAPHTHAMLAHCLPRYHIEKVKTFLFVFFTFSMCYIIFFYCHYNASSSTFLRSFFRIFAWSTWYSISFVAIKREHNFRFLISPKMPEHKYVPHYFSHVGI